MTDEINDPSNVSYSPTDTNGVDYAESQVEPLVEGGVDYSQGLKAPTLDKVLNKQQGLAQKAEQKRQRFGGDTLNLTEQEFIQQRGGNVAPEELQAFREERRNMLQDREFAIANEQRAIGNRSAGDVVGDAAVGIGKGVINTGALLYGVGNLATQGGLDNFLGDFAPQFNRTKEFLDKFASGQTQLDKDKQSARAELFDAFSDERIQEDIASGTNETIAELKEQGRSFANTLSNARSEGLAVSDIIAESAIDLVFGAGIGKFAASRAVAAASKNGTVQLSAREIAEVATKAGATSNVVYSGLTEGMSNATEVKEEIEGLTPEQLQRSPDYQDLINQGMSHEEARQQLSIEAFNITLAVSGILGAGISKFTGSADFVGNLLNGSTLEIASRGIIGKAIQGGATEGLEETLQGIAGQFGSNVGKQETVDPDQKLTEGTGRAGALGLVAGAATGGPAGAVSGVSGSVQNARAAKDKVSDTVSKQTEGLRRKKFEKSSGVESSAAFTANESLNRAEKAKSFDDTKAAVIETLGNLEKLSEEIVSDEAALVELNKSDNATPEEIAGAQERIETKKAIFTDIQTKAIATLDSTRAQKANNPEVVTNPAKVIKAEDSSASDVKAATDEAILGTNFSDTGEGSSDALDAVINSDKTTQKDKADARILLEAQNATADRRNTSPDKSAASVSAEILEGNERSQSLEDRQNSIAAALRNGDNATAQRLISQHAALEQRVNRKLDILKQGQKAVLEGDTAKAQELSDQWKKEFKTDFTVYKPEFGNNFGAPSLRKAIADDAVVLAKYSAAIGVMQSRVEAPATETVQETQAEPAEQTQAETKKEKLEKGKTVTLNDTDYIITADNEIFNAKTKRKIVNEGTKGKLRIAFQKQRGKLRTAQIGDVNYNILTDGSVLLNDGRPAKLNDQKRAQIDAQLEAAQAPSGSEATTQEAEAATVEPVQTETPTITVDEVIEEANKDDELGSETVLPVSPQKVKEVTMALRIDQLKNTINLSQPIINKFVDLAQVAYRVPKDVLTGFFLKQDTKQAIGRALSAVVANPEAKITYVGLDIANLGGLNDFFKDLDKADAVLKDIMLEVEGSLKELLPNSEIVPFKDGGDEFAFIIENANALEVAAAIKETKRVIRQMFVARAKEYGTDFNTLANPKHSDAKLRKVEEERDLPKGSLKARPGVSIYTGVVQLEPTQTVDSVRSSAALQYDAEKDGTMGLTLDQTEYGVVVKEAKNLGKSPQEIIDDRIKRQTEERKANTNNARRAGKRAGFDGSPTSANGRSRTGQAKGRNVSPAYARQVWVKEQLKGVKAQFPDMTDAELRAFELALGKSFNLFVDPNTGFYTVEELAGILERAAAVASEENPVAYGAVNLTNLGGLNSFFRNENDQTDNLLTPVIQSMQAYLLERFPDAEITPVVKGNGDFVFVANGVTDAQLQDALNGVKALVDNYFEKVGRREGVDFSTLDNPKHSADKLASKAASAGLVGVELKPSPGVTVFTGSALIGADTNATVTKAENNALTEELRSLGYTKRRKTQDTSRTDTRSERRKEVLKENGKGQKSFMAKVLERGLNSESEMGFFEQVQGFLDTFKKEFQTRTDNPVYQQENAQEIIERNYPALMLADENGQFDDLTLEHMGLAFLEWVEAFAESSQVASLDSIRRTLGKSQDETLTNAEIEKFQNMGLGYAEAATQLGNTFLQRMGISATQDANDRFNLALNVGLHILTNQAIAGRVQINRVPHSDSKKGDYSLTFVRVTKAGDMPDGLIDNSAAYSEAVQGETWVEFPVEDINAYLLRRRGDSQVANEDDYVPGTPIRKTVQRAAPEHQAQVDEASRTPYELNPIAELYTALPEEMQLEIAGHVSEADIAEQRSNEANTSIVNNRGIRRTLQMFNAFRENLNERASGSFYIPYTIWSNLRMGQVGSLTPQNNKIIRHLFAAEAWRAELSTDNPQHMHLFKMAVVEAMGGDPKKRVAEIEAAYDQLTQKYWDAIGAMQTLRFGGELTAMQQKAITDAVKDGGEKLWSFEGLAAMAAHLNSPDGRFVTHLFREVDGTNNGVMLSLMQVALGENETLQNRLDLLEQGGFFDPGKYDSYIDYLEKNTNGDAYQDIVVEMSKILNRPLDDEDIASIEAQIDRLYNSNRKGAGQEARKLQNTLLRNRIRDSLSRLAGFSKVSELMETEETADPHFDKDTGKVTSSARKLAKSPLMTMIFGKSEKGIKADIAKQVLEQALSVIDSINIKDDFERNKGNQHILDIIRVVNENAPELKLPKERAIPAILKEYFYSSKNKDTGKKSINLKQKYDEAFVNNFAETYSEALMEGMRSKYGQFMEQRTLINDIYNFAHQYYVQVVQEAVARRKQELGRQLTRGEVDTIIREMSEFAPTADNPYNNDPAFRIIFSKFKQRYAGDRKLSLPNELLKDFVHQDESFPATVQFNDKIVPIVEHVNGERKVKMYASNRANGAERVIEEPGVKGGIGNIHQLDAAIYMQAVIAYKALGIHDAAAMNLLDTEGAEKQLNADTLRVMQEFSISEGLERVLDSIAPLVDDQEAYTELRNRLAQYSQREAELKQGTANLSVHQYVGSEGGMHVPETDGGELGSSNRRVNNINFGPNANTTTSRESAATTLSTFDQLGHATVGKKDSLEHTANLRTVIENLVNKVLVPFDLAITDHGDRASGEYSPKTGNIRIQKALTSAIEGLRLSAQEIFAHELVHKVTAAGIDSDVKAARQLRNLFNLVRSSGDITPEDFMSRDGNGGFIDSQGMAIDPQRTPDAWAREYREAQRRQDYIFNNKRRIRVESKYYDATSESYRNPMLHEFMAFGLTNAAFGEKLKSIQVNRRDLNRNKSDNIFVRLRDLFFNILDTFSSGYSQESDAHAVLMALGQELTNTRDKNQSIIAQAIDLTNDKIGQKTAQYIVEPIQKWAKERAKNETRTPLDRAARLIDISPEGYRAAVRDIVNRYTESKNHWFKELSDELMGPSDRFKRIHSITRLVKTHLDHGRKETEANISKVFRDLMPDATPEQRRAITQVLLMTDVGTSIEDGTVSVQDVLRVIGDPAALSNEIDLVKQELEAKFAKPGDRRAYNWYTKLSKSLGHYQATGRVLERGHFAHNAALIANLSGNPYLKQPSQEDFLAARPLIDKLAMLHAIQFTDKASKESLTELASTNAKELDFVIKAHIGTQNAILEKNFGGQIGLMEKGYVPDLVNPHVSFKTATKEELPEMERKGYTVLYKLPQDPLDQKEQLYAVKSNYNTEYTLDSGMVSLARDSAKGTLLVNTTANRANPLRMQEAEKRFGALKKAKEAQMKRMMEDEDTTVPSNEPVIIPVTDNLGNITDYRYVMSQNNRRKYLEKDESFDRVMAALEVSMVNKEETLAANSAAIVEARKEYLANFHRDPTSYIQVGPNAPTTIAKETWNMLPPEMKSNIRKVWGNDGMYIHQDAWKAFFGQRQIGVGTLDYIDLNGLNSGERLVAVTNNVMTRVLNSKYGVAIEANWQDFVRLAKDTIVIRSLLVLKDNILSNNITLMMLGLNPLDAVRLQVEAFVSAKEYQADTAELAQLQFRVQADPSLASDQDTVNRIADLQNAIANNRVRELFEAGVYQSITEDVYTLDEDSQFKTNLEKIVSPVSEKVGELIPLRGRKVLSTAALRHGTPVYTALRDLTQLSDFMARYALHQHNMKQGMSKEESVEDIVETFINYDTPTTPMLQYLNDMGIVMFTKFWIRNQRVLVRAARERPASVALLKLIQVATGDLADIYDSHLFTGKSINMPWDVVKGAMQNHPLYYLGSALWP